MTTEFKLPALGEDIESGEVINVSVKAGDTVRKDQTLLEIEAGKATMEIPSPVAGTVKAVHVKTGDKVKAGQPVASIEGGEAAETPEANPENKPLFTPAAGNQQPETGSVKAVSSAPNVRRLARELGVDIHGVPVSATDGHISAEDVKVFARGQLQTGKAADGEIRIEKMSSVRQAVMQHMAHCWATVPHVTQHDMADITRLEELRRRYAPKAEAAGAKLTMTAILVKIAASALKVHSKFNSSINPDTAEIIYKNYCNIGVAVDTPKGLLVPVICDADRKNIVELAQEIGRLAAKAHTGRIAPEELQNGTFTVTNLGGIGGSFFTPIVNAPEVAILGAGRAIMDPCVGWRDGLCAPRLRLPLSLSYDHRVIDGADGARFLRWIVEAIEEPMLISLEG